MVCKQVIVGFFLTSIIMFSLKQQKSYCIPAAPSRKKKKKKQNVHSKDQD